MGQYFTPVFLNSAGAIVHALNPADYGSGDKLYGHSRADTRLMYAVQTLLALDGGLRLVWAGDCADPEPNVTLPQGRKPGVFGYVCNADKRQYIENLTLAIDDTGWRRTPLPILTAEGGLATPAARVGSWARDRIYYSERSPGVGWTAVSHPA